MNKHEKQEMLLSVESEQFHRQSKNIFNLKIEKSTLVVFRSTEPAANSSQQRPFIEQFSGVFLPMLVTRRTMHGDDVVL